MFAGLPYAAAPYAAALLSSLYPAPEEDGDFEPILFLSPQYSDAGTIEASSEASDDTPAELMQTMQPYARWRSEGVSEYIDLTTRGMAANMLVLTGTNLLPGDCIRVEAYSDAARTALVLDTGLQPAWRGSMPADQIVRNYSHRVRWENESEYMYWRIHLYASSGQTYIEVGRLNLGRYYQPTISCDCSDGFSFVPYDGNEITDYGNTFTEDHGLPIRAAGFRFSTVDESEAFGDMLKLRQLRGNHGDFFVDLFPWRVQGWEKTAMQATFKAGNADFTPRPLWNGSERVWGTMINAVEVG